MTIMKQFIYSLILLLPFASQAQCISDDPNSPPCNGFISTDSSRAVNRGRPSMRNTFNWRSKEWATFHPDKNPAGVFYQKINDKDVPKNTANPFYNYREESLGMISFYRNRYNPAAWSGNEPNPAYIDFHPGDGWELLHKHNGIRLDGQTMPLNENRRGPYFVFYNRYTGKLRVLAALPITESGKFITRIEFSVPKGNTDLNYSGLFGKYAGTIRALDKKTVVKEVKQFSKGVPQYEFFVSEFETNYDPCICQNRSKLKISFDKEQAGTLTAGGRLIATSVPLDNSGNSPLLNGRDFLSSVYTDGFNHVQGGMVTYQNINKLVQQYEAASLHPAFGLFKLAINALLPVGGEELGKLLSKPAFKFLTGKSQFGKDINELLTGLGLDTDSASLTKTLGSLGKGAKYLSSVIFPSQPCHSQYQFY